MSCAVHNIYAITQNHTCLTYLPLAVELHRRYCDLYATEHAGSPAKVREQFEASLGACAYHFADAHQLWGQYRAYELSLAGCVVLLCCVVEMKRKQNKTHVCVWPLTSRFLFRL